MLLTTSVNTLWYRVHRHHSIVKRCFEVSILEQEDVAISFTKTETHTSLVVVKSRTGSQCASSVTNI